MACNAVNNFGVVDNMAERNAHGKNALEFGKASMYVIAEHGLQKEPFIHHNKSATDGTLFSGKNVIYSRTKAIDFSWKEIVSESGDSKKIRVLDLNGSVRVNVNMKRHSEKTQQYLAGAKSKNEHLNQPIVCLNTPGVNDVKQTPNEDEPASCLCSIPRVLVHGYKKDINTAEKFIEKTSKKVNDEIEKYILEKKGLPYSRYSDSLLNSGQATGNSTNLNSEKEKDGSGNPYQLRSDVSDKNTESSGKCYLKRIFYSKGNNYLKPSNPTGLPQIPRKESENQTGTVPTSASSSSAEETTERRPPRTSNKHLLPLNVNFLKNGEKRKQHFQSIVKLPTVVDKKTGQVHLLLEAVAYEQSHYNKWSRRQKRITPGNAKDSSFSFHLITKNSR